MRKNSSSALWANGNKRGTSGKIFSTILAFLLGIIVGVGALFASGYFILSNYTIKQGTSAVGQAVGTDIDYSQYVSEEYANKTVLNALKDVYSLTQKGDSLTLADLDAVSPAVGTQIGSVIDTLKDKFAIDLSKEELMATAFSALGGFVKDSLFATELGGLLASPSINMLVEDSPNYTLLMLLCYGKEGEDYDLVNGEVVMAQGKTATTIDDLFGSDGEGIVGVFKNLEVVDLFAAFNSDLQSTSLTDALFYETNDEGETYALTVQEFLDRMASGDLMEIAGGITLADAFSVNANSKSVLKAVAYGSECLKDDEGDYIITDENGNYTGDYIIKDGEIVVVSGRKLTTLRDLTEGDFVDNLKIGDLLDENENQPALLTAISDWTISDLTSGEKINSLHIGDLIDTSNGSSNLLNAISDWTINDLSSNDKINSLKLADVIGIDENSTQMMIAIAYGSECKKVNGEYVKQEKDETTGKLVDTGDYYYDENGKIVMLEGHTPTTLGDLADGSFVNTLKIGDLIGESDSTLLNAIADYTLDDLSNGKIEDEVTIEDLLGKETVENNFLLKHIASSTLNSLANDITKISITDLFEESIYKSVSDEDGNFSYYVDASGNRLYQREDGSYYYITEEDGKTVENDSSRVVGGTWKYLLTAHNEDGTTEVKNYTVTQFDEMVENVQDNIQVATLYDMADDGILEVEEKEDGTTILDKKINYKDGDVTYVHIGDMTINILLDYVGYLTSFINI